MTQFLNHYITNIIFVATADFEIVGSDHGDVMDIDFKPLSEIWRDKVLSLSMPAPAALSSKFVVPSTSKRLQRDIPKVVIPPHPQPESPSVPAAPAKKGKPATKAKGLDIIKTIPIEEVPAVDLLSVSELEGLQDSVDLTAVSNLFYSNFSFFYLLILIIHSFPYSALIASLGTLLVTSVAGVTTVANVRHRARCNASSKMDYKIRFKTHAQLEIASRAAPHR